MYGEQEARQVEERKVPGRGAVPFSSRVCMHSTSVGKCLGASAGWVLFIYLPTGGKCKQPERRPVCFSLVGMGCERSDGLECVTVQMEMGTLVRMKRVG